MVRHALLAGDELAVVTVGRKGQHFMTARQVTAGISPCQPCEDQLNAHEEAPHLRDDFFGLICRELIR
jgi:hypothetical protein